MSSVDELWRGGARRKGRRVSFIHFYWGRGPEKVHDFDGSSYWNGIRFLVTVVLYMTYYYNKFFPIRYSIYYQRFELKFMVFDFDFFP